MRFTPSDTGDHITFFFALRARSQEKSETSKLLREFCIGSIRR
jgi:hypothetical protein